jgi:hypothetical protein
LPSAINTPFIRIEKFPSRVISTPGSIVKVAELETPMSPDSKYGLFAFVQVVFEEIIPETCV